ncbi:hypothetical protein [Kitasatospora sp. NPDC059571]|uniref:hypothetical protein n=1 Tax=Kitasatospora sp. NPDC059571 TaxID=3346871 RepID=UPI00368A6C29
MPLTTTDRGLRLAASDTEVYTTTTVDAEIANDGAALVSGRRSPTSARACPRAQRSAWSLVVD